MKPLLLIILICLFSLTTFAQEIKDEFTPPVEGKFEAMFINQGMINGSHWKSFSEKEKAVYLFGFEDGTINTAIHHLPEGAREKVHESMPSSVEGGSFDYLIPEIDKFYLDEKNTNIPVCYVLLIIRNRLVGVDENKIQRYIEYLRNPLDKDLEEIIKQKD